MKELIKLLSDLGVVHRVNGNTCYLPPHTCITFHKGYYWHDGEFYSKDQLVEVVVGATLTLKVNSQIKIEQS